MPSMARYKPHTNSPEPAGFLIEFSGSMLWRAEVPATGRGGNLVSGPTSSSSEQLHQVRVRTQNYGTRSGKRAAPSSSVSPINATTDQES
jgi:hypothetical protein